jgi:hypothetical protein
VPLWLKLAYSAFVVVHVVINWHYYGPLAFLWSCDIAVITLLLGIWLESRLLVSIEGVAILFPLALWGIDLVYRVFRGRGHYLLGFAGYMFDPRVPWQIRLLSSFHVWLPIILIYLLARLGYDRRAFSIQCLIVTVLMVTCRLVSPPQPASHIHPNVNLNWVYGPSDSAPQHAIPSGAYLVIMIVAYQLAIYLPTHLVLTAVFGPATSRPTLDAPVASAIPV